MQTNGEGNELKSDYKGKNKVKKFANTDRLTKWRKSKERVKDNNVRKQEEKVEEGQEARQRKRHRNTTRERERGGPQMTDLPVNQKRELKHTVMHSGHTHI